MNAGARDTVNIDESVHEIYKKLTEGSDPVNVPFKTMKDIFLWAASLGFQRGERKPIIGKRVTIFRWAQFSATVDLPIIKAIALASTNSIPVLTNQDELLTVVEEYANSGIGEISLAIQAKSQLPLYCLVDDLIH